MEQSSEYIGLLVAFLFATVVAGLVLGLNKLLGPKGHGSAVKSEPFECGVEPLTKTPPRFSVKFYLIAMLFILFDVEIVWFFPWAVALRELRWIGLAEMFLFIGVLGLGFTYAWKKGALEWQK